MRSASRRMWLVALAMFALSGHGPPEAPVADAAMRDDVEEVRSLLERGVDPNAAQGDGMTGLHWAAERGSVELASALIDAGAELDPRTRLGSYTPVHLAARGGHDGVLRLLLEGGASPSMPTTTGAVTPLHFAATSANPAVAVALLEHGADPDAREERWGQTPLMFAAAAARPAVVDALLDHGADPESRAYVLDLPTRAAEDAADRDRVEEARESGKPRASVRRPSFTSPRPAERPVDKGGLADREGESEVRSYSSAELIGGYGGLSALLMAVREGSTETALRLVDGGADIDGRSAGDGTSPLLMATINGHFDLALQLLEGGADPRLQNDAGATALYTAINTQWIPKSRHPQPAHYKQQKASYLQVMEALLEAGVDPNVRLNRELWFTRGGYLGVDRMGATPFWRAAYALDVDAMKLLVEHGADPTIPTMKAPSRRRRGGSDNTDGSDPSGLPAVPPGGPGVYPIHAASGVGYGEGYAGNVHRHVPDGWMPAVKYLVEELGADVNVRDHNGYNALHHAAARGDNDMILYLVEQGADVMAVSRRGQTTVDMANGPVQRITPFPETIRLLEGLGAKNNHNCVSC
ncbi:MAG: ankyrin repeat domain-containing protein [Gemmatimonadota bacterium]|nr:ankyrin repeat domain-containing protein [Gemmatimonadota bacterium]